MKDRAGQELTGSVGEFIEGLPFRVECVHLTWVDKGDSLRCMDCQADMKGSRAVPNAVYRIGAVVSDKQEPGQLTSKDHTKL